MRLQVSDFFEMNGPGETDDTTANEEAEETDGNSLARSKSDPHDCRNSGPKRRSQHITAP